MPSTHNRLTEKAPTGAPKDRRVATLAHSPHRQRKPLTALKSLPIKFNGTVQRAAAKDLATAGIATTAAPLQPMVPRRFGPHN